MIGNRRAMTPTSVHGPAAAARSVLSRAGSHLGVAALLVGALALLLALVLVPHDAVQGASQRLMYVHVPAAWTAFCAFACVALCSIAVLLRGGERYDAVAGATAEVGVAMTALALVEGSIWGSVAWGVWWTWDPRLVSTALLLLSYVVYLALRSLPGDPGRAQRRNAVVGLLLALQVPVVHFSVIWWRTVHQEPTVLRPDLSPPIAPSMLVTLLVAVVAFLLGAAWYVRRRVVPGAQTERPASAALATPQEETLA
jgi:heme exporter protein C